MNLVYPYVEVKEIKDGIEFRTILRKKHKGKWYNFKVFENSRISNKNDKISACNSFHRRVYEAIITGEINEKISYKDENFFKLCENQYSEKYRIENGLMY